MGATRVFALLGDPVVHSLSPAMHNAAFAATAFDAVYVARRCSTDEVATHMRALVEAGGGGNVTVPHKATAFAALDLAGRAARATGACNTFWSEDGALAGDNTDVDGFAEALRELGAAGDGPAVVIGAGGAARAAVHVLADHGATVRVHGRTAARAQGLVADALAADGARDVKYIPDPLALDAVGLVVNATPLGLSPSDPAPIDLARCAGVTAVLDMTYADRPSALAVSARERSIPYRDGRTMLLGQAAAAFRRWTGIDPPREAMRRVVFADRSADFGR